MRCQVKRFVNPKEEELNDFLMGKDVFKIAVTSPSNNDEYYNNIWIFYKSDGRELKGIKKRWLG